jgi:hypothetical protein
MPVFTCDNGGTPNDISDDTYTAVVSPFNTESDIALPDVSYGPFNVTDGDQTVTLTDPNDTSCTGTYTIVAPAHCDPFSCPDYDICIDLVSEDGCNATYHITIDVESSTEYFMSDFQVSFFVGGNGTVTSQGFINPNGPLSSNLVLLTGNSTSVTLSQGAGISSLDLDGILPSISIEVQGNAGLCVSVGTNTGGGIFFDGMPCLLDLTCQTNMEFCPTGQLVDGQITTLSNSVGPCPNTNGLGIEGADVVVSNNNGSCSSISDISGRYGCNLCEDSSYDICVTTTCDEPCGLENADVMQMQQILNGGAITAEVKFKGDLNLDGQFSAFDRGLAIKKLNGQDVSNFVRSWCRFVPLADYTDAVNGVQNTIDIDECFATTTPELSVDFYRFALGDFNGSCDDCTHNDGTGPFPITVEQGSEYALFDVEQDIDLESFIFDITLNENMIISSIESNIQGIKYAINENTLKISWFPDKAANLRLRKGDELFKILGTGIDKGITVIKQQSFLLDSKNEIYQISRVDYRSNLSNKSKILRIGNHNEINLDHRSEKAFVSIYKLNGILLNNQDIVLDQYNTMDYSDTFADGIYIVQVRTTYDEIVRKIVVMNP